MDCPRCFFGQVVDGECIDCGLDAEDVALGMFDSESDSLDEFGECPVCHEILGVGEDGELVCLWCTEGIA